MVNDTYIPVSYLDILFWIVFRLLAVVTEILLLYFSIWGPFYTGEAASHFVIKHLF